MDTASLPPGPGPAALNMLGWVTRPIPFMEHARRRFGDRFAVDMGPAEGTWIFITQPDEIREIFLAPADVLHPGAGAGVLEPVVGSRSVLLLDGREHLTQRKLMLPPSTASGCGRSSGVMEEVAAREVDAAGAPARRSRCTAHAAAPLEIILRAVFGLAAGPRLDELRVYAQAGCSTSAPRR